MSFHILPPVTKIPASMLPLKKISSVQTPLQLGATAPGNAGHGGGRGMFLRSHCSLYDTDRLRWPVRPLFTSSFISVPGIKTRHLETNQPSRHCENASHLLRVRSRSNGAWVLENLPQQLHAPWTSYLFTLFEPEK